MRTKGNEKPQITQKILKQLKIKTMTHAQVIKANWENAVRFYFQGSTLSELKAFVKMQIEKEVKSYEEWQIRRSPEFKDAITNQLY